MTTTLESVRTPEGFRAWRKAHALSQQDLAQRLEVTWVSVSRWENGHHPIPRIAELALRYLDEHPEEDNAPPSVHLTATDGLIIELCNERGVDLSNLSDALATFRAEHNAADLDAAVAGDKRAMIRLRKACGLRAFR